MKGINLSKRTWIIVGGALALVLSFLFSDGVRHTLSRRQAIKDAEKELDRLSQEAESTREKINQLESNPKAYEHLVRKELGYMKPGEKEARFLNKK